MGVVLLATHIHLGQDVAVKLLHGGASDTTRKRFLREARLAAKLDSPHVGRVLDYGFSGDGTPYLVMELLVGRTLAKRMETGPLSIDEALSLSRQLLTGLSAIHRSGVVHRDLKPSNLFLCARNDGTEELKIIDFGIAKRMKDDMEAAGDPSLTSGGEVIGTLRYMSPEQLRHSAGVDARADIWSAGVVMYQLFTGRPPLSAESGAQMAAKVLSSDVIADATTYNQLVTPAINHVLQRCLRRDPAERYATAEAVLAELPMPAAFAPAQMAEPKPPTTSTLTTRRVLVTITLLSLGISIAALMYLGAPRGPMATLHSGLVSPNALPKPRDLAPDPTQGTPAVSAAKPALPSPRAKPRTRVSAPAPKTPVDPRFSERH